MCIFFLIFSIFNVIPAFGQSAETDGSFSFYAIYDRLVDTDSQDIRLSQAAMSMDGEKLIFSGTKVKDGSPVLYTQNADGTELRQVDLPDLAGGKIAELAIDSDGSRAFFSTSSPPFACKIYKVEDGNVKTVADTSNNEKIGACDHLQTTADGAYVYFRDFQTNDVMRVTHSGQALETIIDDSEVPRKDSQGRKGWSVSEFAISDDASAIAFVLSGWSGDPTTYNGIFIKYELFVLDTSGYRQLTDEKGVGKDNIDISGDGNTIVFRTGSPQNKWYSIRSDGSAKNALENAGFNFGGISLTYDGKKMVYSDSGANGGRLVSTDGSQKLDIFPGWNVAAITISAHSNLHINNGGERICFLFQYSTWPFKEALYVGNFNDPEAVSNAPSIHNMIFEPESMPRGDPEARVILTSRIIDPQGSDDIERTSTDELIEGKHATWKDSPAYFSLAAHDDGSYPDKTSKDGVFSTEGKPGEAIDREDQLTVRMGAMDASKTITVADSILSIGEVSQGPSEKTTAITPAISPGSPSIISTFSGLIFESRKKPGGSTVQIPLTLKGIREKIGNMDITLDYDPSVLDAKEASKGMLTSDSIFDFNILDGTVKMSLAVKGGFSGDGSIAYIVFDVIGARGSESNLRIKSLSANKAIDMTPMNIPTKNGLFVVSSIEESLGDCTGEGEITAADALCALQMAVGKKTEDMVMDVNGDQKVSSLDARKILRSSAGLEMLT
jgi:hypothetical protein